MVFIGKILPLIIGILLALVIAGIVILIVRQVESNKSDKYEKRDN
jgi:uncharacterized integral membrane protein